MSSLRPNSEPSRLSIPWRVLLEGGSKLAKNCSPGPSECQLHAPRVQSSDISATAMSRPPDTSQLPPTQADWDRIANSRKFADLLAVKKKFIVPAFVFFLIYYLLLHVLVGYAPTLMSTAVFGTINLAYLFALSQFVVGWTIAWSYLRASAKVDRLTKDILEDLRDSPARDGRGGQ